MKKIVLSIGIAMSLVACGGYSDDQATAAEELCTCIENDAYGNFDINFFECDLELKEKYSTEIFEEGSWVQALEEKCPEVADKME